MVFLSWPLVKKSPPSLPHTLSHPWYPDTQFHTLHFLSAAARSGKSCWKGEAACMFTRLDLAADFRGWQLFTWAERFSCDSSILSITVEAEMLPNRLFLNDIWTLQQVSMLKGFCDISCTWVWWHWVMTLMERRGCNWFCKDLKLANRKERASVSWCPQPA